MKIDPSKLTTCGIRRAARAMRVEAQMLDRILALIDCGELSPEDAARQIGDILATQPVLVAHMLGQVPLPTIGEVSSELCALCELHNVNTGFGDEVERFAKNLNRISTP